MKHRLIHVTDHALVRYIERVEGRDMAALRDQIVGIVEQGVDLGACGVGHRGFVFKLDGKKVVTVLPRHHPDIRLGRKRR